MPHWGTVNPLPWETFPVVTAPSVVGLPIAKVYTQDTGWDEVDTETCSGIRSFQVLNLRRVCRKSHGDPRDRVGSVTRPSGL